LHCDSKSQSKKKQLCGMAPEVVRRSHVSRDFLNMPASECLRGHATRKSYFNPKS
jgi:hypothetical protein